MYTQRIINGQTLRQSATERQWNVLPNVDDFFSSHNGQRIHASLFYHPSHRIRLTDFEKKSPYKPTYALLNSVPTPAGIENRKRFIQSLALWDAQEFFDGGWTLAIGEEEAVVNTMAALRCLANRPYNEAVDNSQEARGSSDNSPTAYCLLPTASSNAIVCRWISDGRSTWAYAVNTTPYRISGKIKLNIAQSNGAPPTSYSLDNVLHRFSELNNKGDACIDNVPELVYENSQLVWRSQFAPFEIQAVRFNAPVQPSRPNVVWSQQTINQMRKNLDDLINRVQSLKTARTMRSLDNPDFELPADSSQPIPRWFVWKNPNQPENSSSGASIDYRSAVSGKSSLHLVCDGWPTAVYSKEIAADATGRFTVSLWVKKDPNVPLRCFIRAKCGNKNVYREALLYHEDEDSSVNSHGEWRQRFFHINDLPLENMDNLCIGFELPQQGEAWIDNVNISDLYFSEYEQRELYKSLLPLKTKFAQGELESCWRCQQGYWPQFLMDCVELKNPLNAPVASIAPYSGAVGREAARVDGRGYVSENASFGAANVQSGTDLVGQPANFGTSSTPPMMKTTPQAQPTQLSGTNQKKNLFNFGKNPNVAVPTPNQSAPTDSPAPQPKKEPEKKTLWQRATEWLPW